LVIRNNRSSHLNSRVVEEAETAISALDLRRFVHWASHRVIRRAFPAEVAFPGLDVVATQTSIPTSQIRITRVRTPLARLLVALRSVVAVGIIVVVEDEVVVVEATSRPMYLVDIVKARDRVVQEG
jgi:hypothetical protein